MRQEPPRVTVIASQTNGPSAPQEPTGRRLSFPFPIAWRHQFGQRMRSLGPGRAQHLRPQDARHHRVGGQERGLRRFRRTCRTLPAHSHRSRPSGLRLVAQRGRRRHLGRRSGQTRRMGGRRRRWRSWRGWARRAADRCAGRRNGVPGHRRGRQGTGSPRFGAALLLPLPSGKQEQEEPVQRDQQPDVRKEKVNQPLHRAPPSPPFLPSPCRSSGSAPRASPCRP